MGSLAAKVREKMIFPGAMQILSTNIGPAGRANVIRGRVVPHYSGFGPFSFEDFQSALDDGEASKLAHRVQMELAVKSKSGNIRAMTAYAFIEHQTCAELWIALVSPERSDGTNTCMVALGKARRMAAATRYLLRQTLWIRHEREHGVRGLKARNEE